jgi:hypothetical protein
VRQGAHLNLVIVIKSPVLDVACKLKSCLYTILSELQLVILTMLAHCFVNHTVILAYDLLAADLRFLCGKNYWYFVVDLCALISHRYIQMFLLFPFVI